MFFTSINRFLKVKSLLPLLFIAACSGMPNDDGSLPPPIHVQPQSFEANPADGYTVNTVTGRPVQPIIYASGDTVITGQPIPTTGFAVHPDSVTKPKVIRVGSGTKRVDLWSNVHVVPPNLKSIPVDESQLTRFTSENSESDFVLINTAGDTIQTGVPIEATGKTVPFTFPKSTPALPMRMKDNARYDIRYLDVDQGLSSRFVVSQLQDRAGNLWFGTTAGVSRYDGKSFVNFSEAEGLSHNLVSAMLEDRDGNLWFATDGGVDRFDGRTFTRFSEEEGLAYDIVSAMLEDRNGNLWFGTWGGGVSRYDGEYFVHFTVAEGLPNNTIGAMMEDRSGNLWFGTDGGVSRYDGESFVNFTVDEGLSDNLVYSLLEDRDGTIWIGTDNGLNRYDGKSFVHYTEAEGLSNNLIGAILEDASGNLWIGTDIGVNRFDGRSFVHFTTTEGLSHNLIFSILKDRAGNLWFGTEIGVNRFDSQSFVRYSTAEGLSNNRIYSVFNDRDGNIWFGTEKGVNRFDGKTLTQFTVPEALADNIVHTMLQDRSGNLWLGTSVGVFRYDGQTFTHFTEANGLSNNIVGNMMEDSAGNLWFGTDTGVNRYDGRSFVQFTEEEGLINNRIYSVLEDREGYLWFGTEKGVSRFDGQTFVHFTEAEGLPNNIVGDLLLDKNGNIWFGTDGGASRYDGETFTHFTEASGLSNNLVYSLREDSAGNIWFGTDDGLNRYDGKSIVHFTEAEGLTSDLVYSMTEDREGNFWFGTEDGVNQFENTGYAAAQTPPTVYLRQLDINDTFMDFRNLSEDMGKDISFDSLKEFENYPMGLSVPYNKNDLSFHFAAIDWAAPNKIRYSYRMLGLDDRWSPPSTETVAGYRRMPIGMYTFQVRSIGESGNWGDAFSYTFTVRPPWWQTWWAYGFYAFLFIVGLVFADRFQRRRVEQKEREKAREKELEQAKEIEKAYNNLEVAHKDLEQAHTNLKSAQDQLVQQEKLASLGQLTAGIAHEIKNPLNFVNNFSEVSLEMVDEVMEEVKRGMGGKTQASQDEKSFDGHREQSERKGEEGKEKKSEGDDENEVDRALVLEILNDIKINLTKIHEHGSRADSIVKSMLLHSRGGEGKLEPTPLNPLVKEYVNLAFHGMRASKEPFDVDLDFQLDDTIGEIPLIAEDFSRVILNLSNNGFDAMREKRARGEASYKPKLTVRTSRNADKVTIEIEDNGPGIPDDIKDKILQPFFTTKKGTQGTGLGLSITNDIIKAHGGILEIRSVENQSIMIIKLTK